MLRQQILWRRLFRQVAILVSVVLFCMWSGVAPSASEEIRRVTYNGIPFDEPILIRMKDVLLRVPAGYLVPWPSPAMRSRVNEQSSIEVHFWMPDKRYVEICGLSNPGFRPQETGRAPPSPDAYIVKASGLQILKPSELDRRSPERRFHNFTSIDGISSYSFKEEFGLARFWRHDWPHPRPEPFVRYRHVEGSDPHILLRCTPPDRSSPNPICDGYVYIAADNLSFYLRLSRTDLPRWRESVLAVRDLFKSWTSLP